MFNLYQYNTRSELTSAERYFGSNTNDISNPVGLQDWSYAYDHIGNRTWTTKANAAANYTANAINQYTERSVPGSSDIIGSAKTNVTVTVNEEEADRQGYYWSHRLTVDNLFNPIYTQVVVEAICDPGTNAPYIASSETGNVFIAASPEEFTYDDDGNLLSDGRFNYSWDAENRLISATTKESLSEDMPIVHVEFAYDYMSRRVGKTVYQWDAGITNWTQADTRSFLYDSWNLISETSSNQTSTITNSCVWGIDLGDPLQSAGGIGGLLASYSSSTSHPVLFCYDGNGNVSELLSMNGTIAAHYEYSPFGETIVATGDLADENKFRFSTKYFDDEIGLSYYGYRYYSPSVGKWVSDDPLMDPGCPAVMAIKKQVLGALEVYASIYATVMLDEKLSDEMRVLALFELVNTGKAADALMRNAPEFWLSMAGDNWTMFCANNPVNFVDPFGLEEFTRAQLETALASVQWGQQVAFDSARLGVRPQDTPTATGKKLQFASPLNPGKDPVVRAFETTISEVLLAMYAHVAGQLANSVDSLLLDKPGNFYNYWGMVEVWRHQRLIDKIQEQLNKLSRTLPPQNPSGEVCK